MSQRKQLDDVSVRGRIAAGGPIETDEIDLGNVPVASGLLRGRDGYALEVEGAKHDPLIAKGGHSPE